MRQFSSIIAAFLIAILTYPVQPSQASTLSIVGLKQTTILDTKQLRGLKTEAVEMDYNRAYPNTRMIYQSIRLCDLLKQFEISPASTLEFVANDHFSVLVPAQKVLNCKKRLLLLI